MGAEPPGPRRGAAPGANAVGPAAPPLQQQSARPQGFERVADRIGRLDADARTAGADADKLRALAMRVLNVRRIADLARARVLAEIPSINPAPGSGIASAFGWRILPWPSYHQGVDLDADYGEPVVAAAAGTVAFVRLGRRLRPQGRHRSSQRVPHVVRAPVARRRATGELRAQGRGDRARSARPATQPGRTFIIR